MSLCRQMARLWLESRPISCSSTPTPLVSFRSHSTTNTPSKPSPADIAAAAEYPHGAVRWYKQANRGLYARTSIQFGNNVSAKNEIKTRRHWSPNIKLKNLYSEKLGRYIQVRVSTRVLRTIDKLGGIDHYLLTETPLRIKDLGVHGWRLRCQMIASPQVQTEFNKRREALGLPKMDYEAVAAEAVAAGTRTDMGRLTDLGRRTKRTIRKSMLAVKMS